jgi:hypothetical protein
MIIRIVEADNDGEGGFAYDVWLREEEGADIEDVDPDDGGIYTGEDWKGVIECAMDTAQTLAKKLNDD